MTVHRVERDLCVNLSNCHWISLKQFEPNASVLLLVPLEDIVFYMLKRFPKRFCRLIRICWTYLISPRFKGLKGTVLNRGSPSLNGSSLEITHSVSLTLFLLGVGGQFDPPVFFLHNSKSIGLSLLKFSEFSYIPKALPLGLKPGFNTNCLSPQAHCLNDCFCL